MKETLNQPPQPICVKCTSVGFEFDEPHVYKKPCDCQITVAVRFRAG